VAAKTTATDGHQKKSSKKRDEKDGSAPPGSFPERGKRTPVGSGGEEVIEERRDQTKPTGVVLESRGEKAVEGRGKGACRIGHVSRGIARA